MPVPVWDCSDLLLDEPLDTVLSDDIWKKFDLDEPLDVSYVHGHHVSGGSSSGAMGDRTLTAMTMMMNSSSSSISSSSSSSLGYSSSSSLGYSSSSSDDSTTHSASSITLPEFYDTFGCSDPRKIRHHDCMWAGLCISKEHNRTLPAKKDSQVHSRKVAAGRSLLISSRPTTTTTTTTTMPQIASQQQLQLQQQQQQQQTNLHQHQILQQSSHPQRRKDSLESDGDSGRPETPQSSEESETESEAEDEEDEEEEEEEDEEEEEERVIATARGSMLAQRRTPRVHEIKREPVDGPLVFRHDQISINEKLSECMSETSTTGPPTPPPRAAPVSEVTGQLVRKFHHRGANHDRIKVESSEYQSNGISSGNQQQQQQQQQHGTITVKKEPDSWNTLSDHCYHQPSSKKLEHLGVQTPSDSEEEIDVVTFEKPCRPAALPTYPSIADQQHFQLTVNSALKEKPASAPRPRGRPPSSGGSGSGSSSAGAPRKRGSAQPDQKPAKRARHRTYQRRSKVTKNCPPTPVASPLKTASTTTATTGSSSATMTPSSSSSSSMAASTSRSNSSSDDEPDTEKRSLHNNMERQRRIELRNAFEDLRVLVPEVEAKEKAPKVAILRQAAVYCDMLTEINQVSVARVIEMKRRQERLRARLSQLRRSLAMTR